MGGSVPSGRREVRHGKNRVAATGIPAADHEFMQFRVAAEDLHPNPMVGSAVLVDALARQRREIRQKTWPGRVLGTAS
jgi:hypothetical protein